MSARNKLNVAYLNGALLFAAVVGAATESWLVFAAALAVALGAALHGGGIRTGPRRR